MKKLFITLSASVLLLGACKKDLVDKFNQNGSNTDINASVSSMSDLKVPAGFDWATTKTYSLDITLLSPEGTPVVNNTVRLMSDAIDNKGEVLLKATTDQDGRMQVSVTLPSTMKEVILNATYLALPKDIIINLDNSKITHRFGGPASDVIRTKEVQLPIGTNLGKSSVSKFNVVPANRTWNSSGVPNYKEPVNDVISQSLLNNIAYALPEYGPLPSNSPLLDPTATRVIKVKETADVYVTFVSEAAGYMNTLFYYTYNENNPPASSMDISNYTVVFPNTSFPGSGGALTSGTKVFLGRFSAGTVIGYGIAANGWAGGSQGFNGVTNGYWTLFGDRNLNTPPSNSNLKEHMVLMKDEANNRYVMGFEDIRRDVAGCDNDFNDVIFYTTANPASAIDDDDVVPLPKQNDDDEDGVDNNDDEYPNDPNKAYNNQVDPGSVAFEDQWPSTGDYDMNDVVLDYAYNVVTNAQNKVVRVEGSLTLRATGGAFQNGCGIQFPVERSKVSAVTGATLESGQTKAVLVLFQNMRNEMVSWNTVKGGASSDEKTYTIAFNVTDGPSLASFGLGAYNPFIWNGSMGRGYEIHLAGKLPTDLANTNVFGTNRDGSNLNTGDTYVTKNGRLPWAIQTPASFKYPVEKADINTAYLKFAAWVQSGGSQFNNWYDNESGFRNTENIY